jgi:glycosyltransferase involved in cell wall biosynthesis
MVFGLELVSARLATRSYSVGPGWPRLYALNGALDCGVEIRASSGEARSAAPSILFVGTWNGRKRGHFLHELFVRTVKPAFPTAELWMVSDEAPSGGGVKWLYGPTDEVLSDLYRRAWVFCLPSTYEGFGIPYIEAMAHGTPVVASPNVGARYVLGSSQGGLIVEDDALGETLVRMLKDPVMRSRMGTAGRMRAGDFAWDPVLDAHEHAYEDAIVAWKRSVR